MNEIIRNNFSAYEMDKEIALKKRDFINLNFNNNDKVLEFYAREKKHKFIDEIGPRGGIKRLTIKESNIYNPFVDLDEDFKFTDLESYINYVNVKRKESNEVEVGVKKRKNIFNCLMFFFVIFVLVALGSFVWFMITLSTPESSTPLTLMILFGILFLIFGICSYLYDKSTKNIFFGYYNSISVPTKNRYFSLKHSVEATKSISIEDLLDKKRAITFRNLKNGLFENNNQGIYVIKIHNDKNADGFKLPIYVGQATNLSARWKQHINNIENVFYEFNRNLELKYEKIVEYVKYYELSLDDIHFYIVEENKSSNSWSKEELKELETKWINVTGSGSRGFNAIR